ncbi:MAG: hypothetical protein E7113_02640 [Bacteroidales bacterium]|nr:hypothetical protein [Bacteroidales bacterium]
MHIALYTLTSPLHDEAAVNAVSSSFIDEIESELGLRFDFRGNDFSRYGESDLDIIFVRTGGTEGLFKKVFPSLEGNILLMTSGKSNSLAASLEIMSYLNHQGRKGEILHGSASYIAERINVLSKVAVAMRSLEGKKLGIIGKPSDWLISSHAGKEAVKEKLGINLLDINIQELIEEIGDIAVCPQEVQQLKKELESNASEAVKRYAEGALKIYAALKNIVNRYDLSGLTLRCFDLLDTVGNTGCLALAMLNSEGIPSGCEGDVPALLSMTIGQALTGQCGFQSNPSRIDPQTGELLLAHCTIPFNMVLSRSFNTHFESGIGVAVHGEMPAGDATIFKVSGDLGRSFCAEAELLSNQYENNLCRTQINLRLKETPQVTCSEYFLKNPIGNHHIIFSGAYKQLFEAFMLTINPLPALT